MPFMSVELLSLLPFKADPYNNKVQKCFYLGFENVYLNKFETPNKSFMLASKI